MTFSHSSSVIRSTVVSLPMPALFTITSRPPPSSAMIDVPTAVACRQSAGRSVP
jgi:hypothetical protein